MDHQIHFTAVSVNLLIAKLFLYLREQRIPGELRPALLELIVMVTSVCYGGDALALTRDLVIQM